MNLPWHMESDQSDAPTLFELADGRFQVVSKGTLAPVISGYGYLLVEKPLAAFLESLQLERVSFEEATLFYPSTGEEAKTHVRLRVGQFFTSQDIRDLALDGLRMMTLDDQYYFVSKELKAELEQASFPYLRFSEGLTGFGASAA
jgi:hypothetical protein